ncbi:DUF1573 domain-containing protein [Bacteroides reticulotermitis]|uniref:DUF1573 domain-containing protein n=1 Tax=Bacteroides reticulotermitis TaxID=1133319 RepID=A0A840D0F0_9BACE|nr:DUF1573 domain-containing protein [Bacteroides reticulotermitis]MBB4044289.1 hypothetical protein [Bacteroides reticulotermitis]
MSKIIGFIIILIICVSCKQNRKAELSLSSYSHDFGTIGADRIYHDSIIITNVGNAKLEIGTIETGCGCTQASVDKYELNPNESCPLRFSFSPKGKGAGPNEELIIINANTDSLFYILQIKATIQ